MSSSSAAAQAPELEDELAAFRAQWRQEAERKRQQPTVSAVPIPTVASTSSGERYHQAPEAPFELARSPEQTKRSSLDAEAERLAERVDAIELQASPRAKETAAKRRDRERVQERDYERERERERELQERARPKSALELYEYAVSSEREGRMQDALVNYRSAFRLDPDVDRAYHLASIAAQKHSRGAEPRPNPHTGVASLQQSDTHEFRFERTLQLGPDYDSRHEHRTKEEAQRESGHADADSTHPSSTAFLLRSLLKSLAENPWVRPPPTVRTDGGSAGHEGPLSASSDKVANPESTSAVKTVAKAQDGTVTPSATPEEALAALHFIPADEDRPLPLARLPYEVLLLVLRHLVLSSMLPPPRATSATEEPTLGPSAVGLVHKSKKQPRKRTLREEMQQLELELELEEVDRDWRSDVEALERFARVCRAARVVTLDSGIWRALCLRTFVPPQQISREENALQLVKSHGNDWRRFYIEHPRIRLDGTYISVVTYLRRGEASTHIVTFYRYLRFYHHGLVLSLLTTDSPSTVVRRLNPTLRMAGLSFGRWRLRGNRIDLWGLEDPSMPDDRKKYSFRMSLDLKSTARGRMNKLVMVYLATENRRTSEVEEVPIRPSKPFFFSKVAAYVGEERVDESLPRQ